MNIDLKKSIIETMQLLNSKIGSTVVVEDWICTSGQNYERHQTRYGRFILKIEEFRIRTSGSIATFGNCEQQIEFRIDGIKRIDKKSDEIILEINMVDSVWRKIQISFLVK